MKYCQIYDLIEKEIWSPSGGDSLRKLDKVNTSQALRYGKPFDNRYNKHFPEAVAIAVANGHCKLFYLDYEAGTLESGPLEFVTKKITKPIDNCFYSCFKKPHISYYTQSEPGYKAIPYVFSYKHNGTEVINIVYNYNYYKPGYWGNGLEIGKLRGLINVQYIKADSRFQLKDQFYVSNDLKLDKPI